MINNQFIKETAYKMFNLEWKNYSKDFDSILSDLLNGSSLLIPINLTDEIEGKSNHKTI